MSGDLLDAASILEEHGYASLAATIRETAAMIDEGRLLSPIEGIGPWGQISPGDTAIFSVDGEITAGQAQSIRDDLTLAMPGVHVVLARTHFEATYRPVDET